MMTTARCHLIALAILAMAAARSTTAPVDVLAGDGESGPSATVTRDAPGTGSGAAGLPLDCSGAVASSPVLWPLDHHYQPIAIHGVTDPDGDPATITVTGITQDEPLDDGGDGGTCPDGMIDANGVAHLRAERNAAGNGRAYRIAFVATDDRGERCTGTVTVCVPHDRRDDAVCVDDGQTVNSLGSCGEGPALPPLPIIDECLCTGTVYVWNASGVLVSEVRTVAVTEPDDPAQPAPRDTCPAGSRLDVRWHADPPTAIAYRYRLDEPSAIEVGPTVTGVTYHSGIPPDTIPIVPGTKVFRLGAVDPALVVRDTTRRFQLNFDPETWFAGPDPTVSSAPWVTTPNGEKYALLVNGTLPPGGLPGTLLGPDSVAVMPVNRVPRRSFLEIYGDTVFVRREFDTVHLGSWVVFHSGGADRDSRYRVRVADGIELLMPSFPGGPVLTPGGPNGSAIGFRSRMPIYLTPNGPLAQPAQTGLYPFFDPNDLFHLPRIGAYQPMLHSGRAYSVQRAEDGDGARDRRIPLGAERLVGEDNSHPQRPLVLVFDVNYPPELMTTHPGFRPSVTQVDTFFSRTWDLRLPARDPDPYVAGDPIGGPSSSQTLRLRFKVTGKDMNGAPLVFLDPAPNEPPTKYVNVTDINLSVPFELATGEATLTVELCDCALCEIQPGEGRCITRDIPVYFMAPPVEPSRGLAAVTRAGPAIQAGSATALFAPHQDPAGREITFRFDLAAETDADLALYDVTGQRVFHLASARLPAGEHARVWNGRLEGGRPAAPGVYFVRLRTGAGTLARKFFVGR